MKKDENIKVSFLGLKFECTNPTKNAIVILVLLLMFFVVLVALFQLHPFLAVPNNSDTSSFINILINYSSQ